MVAFKGHFDGTVIILDEPAKLSPGQRVVVQVDATAPSGNAWDVLDSITGTVSAPTDWSAEHDHYLYGQPKRTEK